METFHILAFCINSHWQILWEPLGVYGAGCKITLLHWQPYGDGTFRSGMWLLYASVLCELKICYRLSEEFFFFFFWVVMPACCLHLQMRQNDKGYSRRCDKAWDMMNVNPSPSTFNVVFLFINFSKLYCHEHPDAVAESRGWLLGVPMWKNVWFPVESKHLYLSLPSLALGITVIGQVAASSLSG